MPLARRLVAAKPAIVLVAFALLVTGVRPAQGDTWAGYFSSDWFLQGNWLALDGPPTTSDIAILPSQLDELIPVPRTDIQLNASTTIQALVVNSPLRAQYTLTGSNGAVLDATEQINILNDDRQALNVTTMSNLVLTSPLVRVAENAVLALNTTTIPTNVIAVVNDGRIDINNGSSVRTLQYAFDNAAGELRVNSGGELRVAASTTLARGTTTVNSGGQLNALPGVTLDYNGAALLKLNTGYALNDQVTLTVTGGGDVVGTSFLDVGNGKVNVAGLSDWGQGGAGNATVGILNSGSVTAETLLAGTSNARFVGTISDGGLLRTTSTLFMGGGTTSRTVSLDVNAGSTLQTDGLATFNNRAALNLVAGTVNFNGGATLNAGSTATWSGSTLNLGSGRTLLIDGGTFTKTNTTGFIFSNTTTTRLQNNGIFTTPSYFDLGDATLDMNFGFLTVGTTGGTVSDWGAGATTTATLAHNSVATYNSGLRMSTSFGTTSVTVSSGSQLVANGLLQAGGSAASNVTLTANGGQVKSDGEIKLLCGTTATISAAGLLEGQNLVLGSSDGVTTVNVTGAGSLLKARGTLSAGREGSTMVTISGDGDADSVGAMVIGELSGADGLVTVTGTGSTLTVRNGLTVASSGTGRLEAMAGGYIAIANGGVSVGVNGRLDVTGGALETSVGQSITNFGELNVTSLGQVRSNVSNSGVVRINSATAERSVTLQPNSHLYVDEANIGSLTQVASAKLHVELRGATNFDNVSVTSAASLAGDLVLSLAGGFTPALGAQFTFLTAGSRSGTFATLDSSAAALANGMAWQVLYSPTSVSLKVVSAAVPGDYNNNGSVDAADYTQWRDALGTNTVLTNDPTGGMIGAAQYNTWRNNFGQSGNLTALTSAESVPEPAGVVVLLALLISSRGPTVRASGFTRCDAL